MSLHKKEKPEYLCLAIDSMLNQTVAPDEIVIVKDGLLTPELNAVLNEYNCKYKLLNVIGYDENKGLGLALNYGLEHCKNELVARMDTDDISKPDRCEKQLNEFEKNPELSLLGSSVDEFFNDPNYVISKRVVPTTHKDIYEFSKRRSAFNHPTVMYKRSKVLNLGGYRNLRRNQDIDLFGRMLYAGLIAGNIKESLLFFRSDDNLAKRRKSWKNTNSYIGTIKRFWKMGYSSFGDYMIVTIAQITIFLIPLKLQHWVYRKFLRK